MSNNPNGNEYSFRRQAIFLDTIMLKADISGRGSVDLESWISLLLVNIHRAKVAARALSSSQEREPC